LSIQNFGFLSLVFAMFLMVLLGFAILLIICLGSFIGLCILKIARRKIQSLGIGNFGVFEIASFLNRFHG